MNPIGPSSPRLSVVVPVFNEEAILAEFSRRLTAALSSVAGDYEVVCVDDGSDDRSARILEEMAEADDRVALIQLSRNFGMDLAMTAGVEYASGSFVAVIHADLQDPPELLPEMLRLAEGGADVVYARRIGSDESRLKRVMATAFYAMMGRIARVPYQGQAGDFRLMSRRVVDILVGMPEHRPFIRGLVAWVGFTQVPVDYRRDRRGEGRGASYPQLFRLAVEALAAFSDVPLYLATFVGFATAILSGLAAILIVILAALNAVTPSGFLWVAFAVLFLGGVQLISIGIVGRYLAGVHEETLGRPRYIVSRVVSRHARPDAPSHAATRAPAPVRGTERPAGG
jgi:polyisoprenyl-phosphate glycosyltransferase